MNGKREFINGFMEKVALELSFDECNRNCWVETEGRLNQKGLSSRASSVYKQQISPLGLLKALG